MARIYAETCILRLQCEVSDLYKISKNVREKYNKCIAFSNDIINSPGTTSKTMKSLIVEIKYLMSS
jgi:hypothetical protein